MAKLSDYSALMKPTIMVLVVFTGATATVVHGGLSDDPLRFALLLLGIYLIGGCANALNQFFEREVDAKMERTKLKRPLASGRMTPTQGLVFIILLAVSGLGILASFNLLSAAIGLGTVFFYSFFYTLYLKPRTPQNIVIGGAAGAVGPLIGWAAVAGDLYSVVPWVIFSVIFFWTPPHFWALALYLKDDYKKVDYPMMPNVVGDKATYKKMMFYALIMVGVSFGFYFNDPTAASIELIYLLCAVALGGMFIKKVLDVMKQDNVKSQKSLFGYSIIYVFLLCIVIMVDAVN